MSLSKQQLREKIKSISIWKGTDGDPEYPEDVYGSLDDTEIDQILHFIDEYVQQEIYGFHEYIIGKDIIQPESDQAFNYARLHRALDEYINGRRAGIGEK